MATCYSPLTTRYSLIFINAISYPITMVRLLGYGSFVQQTK